MANQLFDPRKGCYTSQQTDRKGHDGFCDGSCGNWPADPPQGPPSGTGFISLELLEARARMIADTELPVVDSLTLDECRGRLRLLVMASGIRYEARAFPPGIPPHDMDSIVEHAIRPMIAIVLRLMRETLA